MAVGEVSRPVAVSVMPLAACGRGAGLKAGGPGRRTRAGAPP